MKFRTLKDEIVSVQVPGEGPTRQFNEMVKKKIEENFTNTRGDLDKLKYKRDLIKNGGFEVWTVTAGDPPVAWTKIGTATIANDDYTCKVTSTGAGNEGVKQTLKNLLANGLYTVIGYARATAGDTAKIWTTGGAKNISETVTSTAWVRIEAVFVVDASSTNVVLNIGSDTSGDIVWFDNIEAYEYN